MKKFLVFALILTVVGFAAGCKKSEQSSQNAPETQANPPQPKEFKPHKKHEKANKATAPLELYNESTLLASVPVEQYNTLTNQSIKVEDKDVQAILLKDLLKKYKMQGKNVILTGVVTSGTLSWDKANASNIYVYVTKNDLRIYSPDNALASTLPKKLLKLTVSATTEAAKTPPAAKQTETKKTAS